MNPPIEEQVWNELVDQAVDELFAEARANMNSASYLSAYARNFSNIYENPNQFIANALWRASGEHTVSFEDGTKWPFWARNINTHGGAQIPHNIWPQSKYWQSVLWLNNLSYLLILGGAAGLVILCVMRPSHMYGNVAATCVVSFISVTFMITQHPGHGRYIAEFLPAAILAASAFYASIITKFRNRISKIWH